MASKQNRLTCQTNQFSLTDYDSEQHGPLFAVSDEGSEGETIVDAAYASAKARILCPVDPVVLGVALDGERMTSAGEVPIGPEEYEDLSDAAAGRLFLTTNVGVRVNARLSQQLPEFLVTNESETDEAWLANVFSAFSPFLRTPDGHPRPLTVRLTIDPKTPIPPLETLIARLESGRNERKIGPAEIHRFSFLVAFDEVISRDDQIKKIEEIIGRAARTHLNEVAVDADLRQAARRRLGVQSLLNILNPTDLRRLLETARRQSVRLTYRYQLDLESAARTIWTGLHTARSNGFSAGKYGLVPMTLEEQAIVIEMITRWTRGWTAIPAFYVDTPLLTAADVYDDTRCKDAAKLWLTMARGAGANIVLFDCPDRVDPRRLLREPNEPSDKGILTITDIDEILDHGNELGLSILWSGGITSQQAFSLAKRKVFGIFSTSSTAAKIAVTAPFESDPRLASENEPTHLGVRRIHAIIQAGFLTSVLKDKDARIVRSIQNITERLLFAEQDPNLARTELRELNKELVRGWQLLADVVPKATSRYHEQSNPVPADAVRVFRGRKRDSLDRRILLEKLGTVFMPMTVQMQRLYGLTAYLPAVLPENKAAGIPDEVALVFYRTQCSYDRAKHCVGGRAYGELHQLVFDMSQSPSSFPTLFTGRIEPGQAYHLFLKSVDWQRGSARICVATCRSAVQEQAFLNGICRVASDLKKAAGQLDAVIFCPTSESLVWWEHSSTILPTFSFPFHEIAEEVFTSIARRVKAPTNLLRPYKGTTINTLGDFLNFQFDRV